MNKKTVLYGNRSLCKMLYLDSLHNDQIEVVAFVVDKAYKSPSGFFSRLPQVAFETVEKDYPPTEYSMIVLEGTLKEVDAPSLYLKAKAKGYTLLNYFSPKAVIAESFVCGDNNVIFELAYVGHNGKMGSNNVIRQQVYLGHDFVLEDNVILNSGVQVGGFCTLKRDVFVGIGATVINDLTLGEYSIVGAGSVQLKHTEPYSKNVGCPAKNIGYRQMMQETTHE